MEKRVEFHGEFNKNVLYLMNRDMRVEWNYSVCLGYELSENKQFYIGVYLDMLKYNERQLTFIVEGLKEVESVCTLKNIHFVLLNSYEDILKYDVDCLITEFSPMREFRNNKILDKFLEKHKIAKYVCDSHNVVPCQVLSTYKRTPKSVRTDLYKVWSEYLVKIEELPKHEYNENVKNNNKFPEKLAFTYFKGGYTEGMKVADYFFKNKLKDYKNRNNTDLDVLSNLSPYLHTGQVSTQQIVYMTYFEHNDNEEDMLTFLNEVFVFKGISDHFLLHEPNYDNINGALKWAKETVLKHKNDDKPYIYTLEQFENADTHDDLWNAGQNQMVFYGKMHGYVRMYWAKRILEWTKDPQTALMYANYLNDKYSIDGNDPNGYAGVMWSICGSMDRAFGERPIFGKIRPMRKFKAAKYIKKWSKKENARKSAKTELKY